MKHIVLIHGLHMHCWSLFLLKKLLSKRGYKVHCFGYFSTQFSSKTIEQLDSFVTTLPTNDLTIVGHSMGGLISRLYLQQKKPNKKISLITLGTPHNGSFLGKKIQKTFLKVLLGSSGQSGIVETIPEWKQEYPLYCIAGTGRLGLLKAIKTTEEHDGTVFTYEAIDKNCAKSYILNNISHTQMIVSKKTVDLICNIIQEEIYES